MLTMRRRSAGSAASRPALGPHVGTAGAWEQGLGRVPARPPPPSVPRNTPAGPRRVARPCAPGAPKPLLKKLLWIYFVHVIKNLILTRHRPDEFISCGAAAAVDAPRR